MRGKIKLKIPVMPIFFQHQVDDSTRLGIWKIEETEEFFKDNVPQHRDVTHPHKRLQHLAGRFLLRFLYPGFPYELIQIADTRKPFLANEQFHFSIAHCGDFAAAIVSENKRVGIDIEIPLEKIGRISNKFLTPNEKKIFKLNNAVDTNFDMHTILWSAKESVFKWYGLGQVDFRDHIRLKKLNQENETILCNFTKTGEEVIINYKDLEHLKLAWIVS